MNRISQSNIARVEVQKQFCSKCQRYIRQELEKINRINNIILYPEHTMVVFSFKKANDLSSALNVLTEIGYPETGERYEGNTRCSCKSFDFNI